MRRPGYLNGLEGIVVHREDPVGAAIRADQTAYRHVIDRQDYQSALARSDAKAIATTRAAAEHGFFDEEKAMTITKLLGLAMAAYFTWIVIGALSSPVTEGLVVIA